MIPGVNQPSPANLGQPRPSAPAPVIPPALGQPDRPDIAHIAELNRRLSRVEPELNRFFAVLPTLQNPQPPPMPANVMPIPMQYPGYPPQAPAYNAPGPQVTDPELLALKSQFDQQLQQALTQFQQSVEPMQQFVQAQAQQQRQAARERLMEALSVGVNGQPAIAPSLSDPHWSHITRWEFDQEMNRLRDPNTGAFYGNAAEVARQVEQRHQQRLTATAQSLYQPQVPAGAGAVALPGAGAQAPLIAANRPLSANDAGQQAQAALRAMRQQ